MAVSKSIRTLIEKQGTMHYMPIKAGTALGFINKGHKRVLCTVNGTDTIHAALLPRKQQGDYYIYAGKALLKKLNLGAGAAVSLLLAPDETTHQFEMPEELAEVLATDPEANDIFMALTPGRQRGLIQLAKLVKSTDKKIERALRIADKIKAGITSPQAVMK